MLRSGQLSLGPRVPAFEQALRRAVGARHASAVSSGTAGAAPGAARGRRPATATRSSRRRSRSWRRPTRSSTSAPGRSSPTSTRDAQPRPGRRGGGDHRRARARCCRCTSSATRPTCPRSRRTALPIVEDACEALGARHADGGAGRRPRPPGGVRLLRQQAADHRRGRHAHARLGRAQGARRLRAQPGPRARHGLARPRPARLQLPPDRHRRARSGWPSSSASTGCSPTARGSPAGTARRSAGIEGLELPCEDAGGDVRGWFVFVVQLPRGVDRDDDDPRAARARRAVQALPAGDPPDVLLPRALRPPRGRVPGLRGRRRALARAAVLPGDDRGPGGARRAAALRDGASGSA